MVIIPVKQFDTVFRPPPSPHCACQDTAQTRPLWTPLTISRTHSYWTRCHRPLPTCTWAGLTIEIPHPLRTVASGTSICCALELLRTHESTVRVRLQSGPSSLLIETCAPNVPQPEPERSSVLIRSCWWAAASGLMVVRDQPALSLNAKPPLKSQA